MWEPLVILENWAVVDSVVSRSYQELRPRKHLTGRVFGHTKLPDANFIFTSPIIGVDSDKGVVQTRRTIYQLGEASEEYKTWDREHAAKSRGDNQVSASSSIQLVPKRLPATSPPLTIAGTYGASVLPW
jgi:hypothetical protein